MASTYYDSQLTAEEIEDVLEAINGILTQTNNGKVLAISNGKFEARSVQWGGGEPTIEPLSVTANGTYTAPSGVDGYSPVTVNVSGGGSLPSGYKRLDFVSSRNGQRPSNFPYINTGILSGLNIQIDITYTMYKESDAGIVCGCRSQSGGLVQRFFPASCPSNATDVRSVRAVIGNYQLTDTPLTYGIHRVRFNDNQHRLYVDGVLKGSYVDATFSASDHPICLFASGDDDDYTAFLSGASYPALCDILYCSISDNQTGVQYRKFIPCYRESDGEVGMFDLIYSQFYSNDGTSEFFGGFITD